MYLTRVPAVGRLSVAAQRASDIGCIVDACDALVTDRQTTLVLLPVGEMFKCFSSLPVVQWGPERATQGVQWCVALG